jgi:hypothetical protein
MSLRYPVSGELIYDIPPSLFSLMAILKILMGLFLLTTY